MFAVTIGSFVKLFFPVDSIKKQIKGKIKSKNSTALFFVMNFIYK
ncbi:MAG: hypothetical protein ACJA1D_000615 [Polaribacter sp.]|jgi:hypothetical protein